METDIGPSSISVVHGTDILATGEVVGIALGSIGGVIVLASVIVALVVYRKKKRPKSWSLEYYDIDSKPKSAPISRSSTPQLPHKKSCPDLTVDLQKVMVRSSSTGCAPDFILPPERIQPYGDHGNGPIMFMSPENCIGIIPELYKAPSDSDDDGIHLPPSEHGRIWFSMIYDGVVEQLNVKVIKIKELQGNRNGEPMDPFVKIYLLPDERNSKTTKTKKKTKSPIYNENFIFEVASEDLETRTVRLSVYEVDKRKVRHALGHVLVPLTDVDKTREVTMWRDLETNHLMCNSLGELNIGLCYLPHNDKIKVIILSGRHFRHLDYDRINGIYVKVQMNIARRAHKSKKTIVRHSREDPTFNEAFSFCISGQPVDTCNFIVTVMVCPKKYLGHNEVYGKTGFGSFMYARGEELAHWQEMMSKPRTTVNKWHVLTNDPAI